MSCRGGDFIKTMFPSQSTVHLINMIFMCCLMPRYAYKHMCTLAHPHVCACTPLYEHVSACRYMQAHACAQPCAHHVCMCADANWYACAHVCVCAPVSAIFMCCYVNSMPLSCSSNLCQFYGTQLQQ